MKKIIICLILTIIFFPNQVKAWTMYEDVEKISIENDIIQYYINETDKLTSPEPTIENQSIVDVVLFVGGSNIAGSGNMNKEPLLVDEGFGMIFNENNSAIGIRSLSRMNEANTIYYEDYQTSLIPAFSQSYYNNTGRKVVAIQAGVKDSSINDWDESDENYKNSITKLNSTINYLKSNSEIFNLGNVYVVWNSGETDVCDPYILDCNYDRFNEEAKYEGKLNNLFDKYKKNGVSANFLIRMGHLYPAESNKKYFDEYTAMIQTQTDYTKSDDRAVLVSTSAAMLSLVNTKNSDNDGLTVMMSDQVTFNQYALDIIGAEAAKNAALYIKTLDEPSIVDYENYQNNGKPYYYTGYTTEKTLTTKQETFFKTKAIEFVNEANKTGIGLAGGAAKAKAYDLQLVTYVGEITEHKGNYNSQPIEYTSMKNNYGYFIGFSKDSNHLKNGNSYIGFDCSGLTSFIYHYVFGLDFDYIHEVRNVSNGPVISLQEGQPNTTAQYIDNLPYSSYTNKFQTSTFNIILDYKTTEETFGLHTATTHANLQIGDLIIGKNSTTDAHVVIYMGQDEQGNHIALQSTSIAEQNNQVDGKNYNWGIVKLTSNSHQGAPNYSHTYKYLTVLRLNENILSPKFIGNDYSVDFTSLSTEEGQYEFNPLYETTEQYNTDIQNSSTATTQEIISTPGNDNLVKIIDNVIYREITDAYTNLDSTPEKQETKVVYLETENNNEIPVGSYQQIQNGSETVYEDPVIMQEKAKSEKKMFYLIIIGMFSFLLTIVILLIINKFIKKNKKRIST